MGCLTFLISCGGPREAAHFLLVGNCLASPKINLTDFIRIGIWVPTYTNVAVDVIFSFIPIPMLLLTTLDRKQKIVVSSYLALSTVGSVCAIAKTFFTFGNHMDPSSILKLELGYASFNTGELAAYIIGGCIATYRPLFLALTRKTLLPCTTADSRPRTNASHASSAPTVKSEKSIAEKSTASARYYRSSSAPYDIERGLTAAAATEPTRPSSIWTNAKEMFTGMAVPYSPSKQSRNSRHSMRLDDDDDGLPIKRTQYKEEPLAAMCMYGDGLTARPSMARHRRHSENRLAHDKV
jgi:hypothetical protein